MNFSSLKTCLEFLDEKKELLRIQHEVDPHLEMAEIQRQIFSQDGPAILFENIKGSRFPAASNIFGTKKRAQLILANNFKRAQKIVELKTDPQLLLKNPCRYLSTPLALFSSLPRRVSSGPILANQTSISELPAIKSWPNDGGAFITLPQVFSADPANKSILKSNMGMYRVQLNGNEFITNEEIGLHYQIHRGIGVHHARAIAKNEPLKVSIFVGGPPAHTFAAIMPLPEGLSELIFAGMLAGRRFRYIKKDGYILSADADFCITGTIDPSATKPEGPFGDHFGYYSLTHDFPVMKVDKVYHRKDAIWPFTVVGRPPQEDSIFGGLIHEITAPAVPSELPGVKSLHAVDAAAVHPLLLAVGSERYVPYKKTKPLESMTLANAILGFGQASLSKYLMLAAHQDNQNLESSDVKSFFEHIFSRADWRVDLHFQTNTTIDTLDYSGTGLNAGSKLVIIGVGDQKRQLAENLNDFPTNLAAGFSAPELVMPGVVCVTAPKFDSYEKAAAQLESFSSSIDPNLQKLYPVIVLVDDSSFCHETLNNFIWVCFTRSNPSHDIYGVDSFTKFKHWGCNGSLIIDARIKPHHAPPLIEDNAIQLKVKNWLKDQ